MADPGFAKEDGGERAELFPFLLKFTAFKLFTSFKFLTLQKFILGLSLIVGPHRLLHTSNKNK